MFINLAIGHSQFNLSEAVQNKTHHFFNSDVQTAINLKSIANGTHQFKNSNFQQMLSLRQKAKPGFHEAQSAVCSEMNRRLIENGTHNLLGCGEFVKTIIQQKLNRPCVKELKELLTIKPTKLGQNWWRKSDEWINSQIVNLRHQIETA